MKAPSSPTRIRTYPPNVRLMAGIQFHSTEIDDMLQRTLKPVGRIAFLLLITTCSGCFELPSSQMLQPQEVLHLEQNWTREQRQEFYHASQGSVLMQRDWFLALEQPEIKFVGSVGLFHENEYLTRFGFLADDVSEFNPEGLPVGFAVTDVVLPDTGERQTVVGLTCAACHVGELHVEVDGVRKAVRIDGGPALIEITTFQKALGAAVLLTAKDPLRFNRFAHRVLQDRYDAESKAELRNALNATLQAGIKEEKENEKRQLYDRHDGGFGRTDALAKIGNFVFGTELDDDNLRVGNAPVRFPPIWDSTWFDWTQYNGSIEQPMVRNIGEALGVRALLNLDPDSERFMQSTVDVAGLHKIESMLTGDQPLQGLHSPQWPASFGLINESKAEAGAKLYRTLCQKCHLPPLNSAEIWEDKYWIANDAPSMLGGFAPPKKKKKFLNLEGVNLGIIGTDPAQATNFFGRYVNTGQTVLPSVTNGFWKEGKWEQRDWFQYESEPESKEYPATELSMGEALQKITVTIAQQYYDAKGFTQEQREHLNGDRNPAARNPLEYRPRPLNGIWASPPYLHNGSVRTIYQLLSPLEERDVVFYTGTRLYDRSELGYKNERFHGAFLYDTRVPGNLNRGHLFDAQAPGRGVIGPRLSGEERLQIIEYLKTLGPAAPPPPPQSQ